MVKWPGRTYPHIVEIHVDEAIGGLLQLVKEASFLIVQAFVCTNALYPSALLVRTGDTNDLTATDDLGINVSRSSEVQKWTGGFLLWTRPTFFAICTTMLPVAPAAPLTTTR